VGNNEFEIVNKLPIEVLVKINQKTVRNKRFIV